MNSQTIRLLSVSLITAGIIFMLAMAFNILPGKLAIFSGTVCFVLSGMVGRLEKKSDKFMKID